MTSKTSASASVSVSTGSTCHGIAADSSFSYIFASCTHTSDSISSHEAVVVRPG